MATIRATFILTDRASGELDKIHDSAERAENRLKTLDKQMERMGKDHHRAVDGISRDLTQWDGDSDKTSRSILDRLDAIDNKMSGFTKRKNVIRVEADTSHATREIGKLDRAMQRVLGRGGDRNNTSRFLGGAGRGLSGLVSGIWKGASKSSQKIGLNLGPISTRLSMLMPLLVAIGGPVASAAAAGLATVAVGITALGAAAIGVVGILGAVTAGIAAMAVPIGIAVSRFNDKRKALELATEHLNKYKHGTKNYAKAQREVNVAMAAFSTEEKKALGNLSLLQGAWDKFVTNGPSGQRAMEMINSSLVIATGLMPVLARQMDRFTARGSNLFASAQKNLPGFKNQLNATMSSWPHIFEQMGKATGHFGMGFLRLLQAASPLLVWMSDKTLEIAEHFDKWMADPKNFKKVRDWFIKMEDPIEKLSIFAWDLVSAFVAMGSDSTNIGSFNSILDSFMRGVGWIKRETPDLADSFVKDLLPALERTAELIGNVWTLTAPLINKAIEGATRLTEMLDNMDGNKGSWIALIGMSLMTGTGQGLAGGLFKGIGKAFNWAGRGRGGAGGGGGAIPTAMNGLDDIPQIGKAAMAKGLARRAGGLVNAAADILAPNVHVTNTLGSPVPVIIVGDLSMGRMPGGRGGKLGGPAGKLLASLATVLGLGAALGADVPAPGVPSNPGVRANPQHTNNRPNVHANPTRPRPGAGSGIPGWRPGGAGPIGDMIAAGAVPGANGENQLQKRVAGLSNGQIQYGHYPAGMQKLVDAEAKRRGIMTPGMRQHARTVALLHAQNAAPGIGGEIKNTAVIAGGLFGAFEGLAAIGGAGAAVMGAGRAALPRLGPALGMGGAAAGAAPAGAMAKGVTPQVNKPKDNGFAGWLRSINTLIDATTARGANQTSQRARAASRVMSTNAQAGARAMLSTFQTAIAGLWDLVGQAVSSAASALASVAASAAGALGLGGGAQEGFGEGAGDPGNVTGFAQLSEMGALQPNAAAVLNSIPGDKTITAVKSDHSKYTSSGNISDHWYGRAFDFVTGGQSEMKAAGKYIRANASKFGVRKSQVFDPGYDPYGGHSGSNSHVHVAFNAPSGDGRGSNAGSAPKGGGGVGSISRSASVMVSFAGATFEINNGDDYDKVVEQLVERLGAAFAANGTTSASEMTGS